MQKTNKNGCYPNFKINLSYKVKRNFEKSINKKPTNIKMYLLIFNSIQFYKKIKNICSKCSNTNFFLLWHY